MNKRDIPKIHFYDQDFVDIYNKTWSWVSSFWINPKTNEIIAIYDSFCQAAKAVNGTQSAITHVIKGDKQTKTHKGYGWKLVDDIVH